MIEVRCSEYSGPFVQNLGQRKASYNKARGSPQEEVGLWFPDCYRPTAASCSSLHVHI